MKKIIYLFITLLIITLDQASKYAVNKYSPDLVVLNTKGMWGFFPYWAGFIGIAVLGFWMLRQKQTLLVYWLILAGGLSNIIDRAVYNGVVDWIHTFAWFPVFNIADMVISVGVVFLLLQEIFQNKTNLQK